MRRAEIKVNETTAGWLWQDENGYHFKYDPACLASEEAEPVSLTLPLKAEPIDSNILFPFFDGLIPEGWLLDIAGRTANT